MAASGHPLTCTDDNISTTPLWAAPCAPALSRSETELGANMAPTALGRELRA